MLRDQRGDIDHLKGSVYSLQVEVLKLTTSFLVKEAVAELEAGLATLLEMFPHSCRVEAAHCLTLVSGEPDSIALVSATQSLSPDQPHHVDNEDHNPNPRCR